MYLHLWTRNTPHSTQTHNTADYISIQFFVITEEWEETQQQKQKTNSVITNGRQLLYSVIFGRYECMHNC